MKLVGDRIPLIFKFLRLVTWDSITYVGPKENAFQMSMSMFVAIVVPYDL
jgi:hypothetical protein